MTQMTKRIRWIVLGFLLALSIINFIDRQTLSVLAPQLRQQFHLSNTDYGRIVAAFSFGMMAAEFPMGMLMDRLGARFGLAFAVACWSLATAEHAVGNSARSFGLRCHKRMRLRSRRGVTPGMTARTRNTKAIKLRCVMRVSLQRSHGMKLAPRSPGYAT